MIGSLLSPNRTRLIGALARYLAEPVSRPAASGDVPALSALLRPGDVLLTDGNSRAAALVRRLTRSPWAHLARQPARRGDDPRHRRSGYRRRARSAALEIQAQRRIVRPLGGPERLPAPRDWLLAHRLSRSAHAWRFAAS
jgi:hypothetical protein